MTGPVRHASARGWRRLEEDSPKRKAWDLAGGLLMIMAVILVCQYVWQIAAAGLDATYVQETIAADTGVQAADTSTGEIAEPQEGDPPVLKAGSEGDFIGWMWIPRLGDDWRRAIQEGTTDVVLDNLGLGHYPDTAMPGGVGNSSYAGHRTASDLGNADTLVSGDAIVIQTADYWYVYHVQTTWVTDMYDTDVIQPVNDESRLLTLTTCDYSDQGVQWWMSTQPADLRLIVRADFVYWAYTADGIPEELASDEETAAASVSDLVRTVSQYAPITPTLAVILLALWAVLALISWLAFRHERPRTEPSWNPLVLSWRLQTGPVALRVILMLILWMGLVFACWAWLCPWLADVIPWLDAPYAAVG